MLCYQLEIWAESVFSFDFLNSTENTHTADVETGQRLDRLSRSFSPHGGNMHTCGELLFAGGIVYRQLLDKVVLHLVAQD